MQNVNVIQPAPVLATPPLPSWRVFLLAVGAGLAVSTLYYSQPMLGVLEESFGAGAHAIGWVPALTQLGYALGILFLAPLGDRMDRRLVISAKAAALVLALLLAASAWSLGALLVASLAIGISATLAQDIVPTAATLAPEAHRGKVVGTVMTGLLLGILLSRVISGFVAEQWSWRAMFFLAAGAVAVLGVLLWRGVPRLPRTTQLGYASLLSSLYTLVRTHAALRRAALSQALLSLGFSAFWSTLAVMLHGAPFHLGSTAAGAFGLAGAAGALAAPLAGRMADRRGPEAVTRLGAVIATVFFALLCAATLAPPPVQLGLLVIGTIGFDLGIQAALIAHQTLVYGIDPGARSRLNAVLMVSVFIGMASGAVGGSLLLAAGGWVAVTGLATGAALLALVVRLWPARRA